ncbi:hypothetical protein BD410DRAFT_845835 [Rickenella mellea]|uniref:Uncharacterized protein n=1 Tax=Rickenella mellea TaxID=50990 RepID=A0A4Y7PGS7_9AGAM|nr:hypothetical protein BD410DRAFT_845835 [Rickenella mellea]
MSLWVKHLVIRIFADAMGYGGAMFTTYNICVLVSYILLSKWFRYVPNPLLEPLLECYSGVTGFTVTTTKLGFSSLMVYDGVMFILILIKTVREGRKSRARILTILFRDGMIYYAVLFALSIADLIATTLPRFEVTLVGSLAPALLAAQSIGASHIILNLRKYSFTDENLTLGLRRENDGVNQAAGLHALKRGALERGGRVYADAPEIIAVSKQRWFKRDEEQFVTFVAVLRKNDKRQGRREAFSRTASWIIPSGTGFCFVNDEECAKTVDLVTYHQTYALELDLSALLAAHITPAYGIKEQREVQFEAPNGKVVPVDSPER